MGIITPKPDLERLSRLAEITPEDPAVYEAHLTNALRISTNTRVILTQYNLEAYTECMEGLCRDLYRGIVRINEDEGVEEHKAQLQDNKGNEKDKSAVISMKEFYERMLANDGKLFKKASTMQGKGELIGVFPNGKICIVDRGDENGNREPVIIAFDAKNNRITITTDTPDRADVMQNIRDGGMFANYGRIIQAVREEGFTLPKGLPALRKEGIFAAVEAVSGTPFVRSKSNRGLMCALVDHKDTSNNAYINVVYSDSYNGHASVLYYDPCFQSGYCGVVRVLRG